MHKKTSISFFCPAYNDEYNLPILIPKVIRLIQEICSSFEVVIVNDGSRDNTGKVADGLAKQYAPNIKVVHHVKNKGYGAALQSGFKHAKKYPYVFFTHGDNQYNVLVLKKMLYYVPSYDAVVGYRTIKTLSIQRKLQSQC